MRLSGDLNLVSDALRCLCACGASAAQSHFLLQALLRSLPLALAAFPGLGALLPRSTGFQVSRSRA